MVEEKVAKRKVAWGITGGGDKIAEYIRTMKELKKQYGNTVDIHVFISKAAETVLKYYKLTDELKNNFSKVMVELNSNSPFLAAWMQTRKYDFLLIAPATSNTVAKLATGIGDTLLTNSAIMSLKAFVPVYLVPTDYREGVVLTKLPNGKEMKLRVRKEEADQTRKLEQMDGMHVLDSAQKIRLVFQEWYGKT